MSTLRVSNIEAKADPSSPTVNEKVKITNSSGDVMLQLDGATPGITTVGINTTTAAFTVDGAQNIQFVGVVTAASLSGNVTGNLTGNVTGNLSGNVTGNLTGNVTGNVTGGITTSQITVGDSFIKSGAVGLGTTDTAGRNAGVGTAVGTVIYNITETRVQVFDGNNWKDGFITNQYLEATGGTVDTSTRPGYKIHTFTGDDTFTVTSNPPGAPGQIEVLVIGGGGNGGGDRGGGGGAAAVHYNNAFPFTGTSPVSVTVGAANQDSVFSTITSDAGGPGGGRNPNAQPGFAGGSGGGGGGGDSGWPQGTGAAGTGDPGGAEDSNSPANGWGNNGGNGFNQNNGAGGGGGGGASANGNNGGPGSGGPGGAGLTFTLDGGSTARAGGQGGYGFSGYGSGGPGGGGDGGRFQPGYGGTAGAPNTGSGGTSGGSGIVIIAYSYVA
jgi:hypothetical protein